MKLHPAPCPIYALQDKAAFIFCVEDRALFCQGCDEAIHVAGTLSANHQRLLTTGIRVGLSLAQNMSSTKHQSEPPNGHSMAQTCKKIPAKKQTPSAPSPSTWAIDDFLQLSDYESGYKVLLFLLFLFFVLATTILKIMMLLYPFHFRRSLQLDLESSHGLQTLASPLKELQRDHLL